MEISSFFNYVTLFFLQYAPNSLIYILAGHAFSKNVIDRNRFILSSIILAFFGFIVKIASQIKYLNLSSSVPQILIIFACIFLLVNINKIKMVKAILSSLIIMIFQLVFEGVYLFVILKRIFKLDVQSFFSESIFIQSVIGLPNLILLAIITLLFYKVMMKRRTQ